MLAGQAELWLRAGPRAHRGRRARPELADFGIRTADPPMQGLSLDRDAALPLALQLLSQSFAAPDLRLDERHLRTMGVRARCDPFHTDALVPGDQPPQAHDRSPRVRKRRQSGDYPKRLKRRAYRLVVHGDVAGVEDLRRNLSDWLDWMGFVDAGTQARLDRYLGYYEPYAPSHNTFDADKSLQEEVRTWRERSRSPSSESGRARSSRPTAISRGRGRSSSHEAESRRD